jgi:hypothetical protein
LGTYQATLTNFGYLSKEWKDNCDDEALLGVSITGYYDNGLNLVCQQCDLKCLSCTNSASNCSTCNVTTRSLVLVGLSGNCECNNGTMESNQIYG